MSNFFLGQADYIFFFSGLACTGLGVVSYILSREDHQRLPWVWLAYFGISQGLSEWLSLVALAWPDGVWFAALRWGVMTGSFLLLAEFGRVSLIRQRGRGPGSWVVAVLTLVAGLGALVGWDGLNAATRYTLGLAGSLGAGWALWTEGRQAPPGSRAWLRAGGAGFLLYGPAVVLMVPQAGFFPAGMLNYQRFTSLTGLPIHLVGGVLAGWIAATCGGYFQGLRDGISGGDRRPRVRFIYAMGAALALILVSGWGLTQFLGNLAREELHQFNDYHAKLIIQKFTADLSGAENAVISLSYSPGIGPALWSRSPQTQAQANEVLNRYQKHFGAEVAYLLDASGVTIASSNREAPDSFVGRSSASRPYFQEARSGYLASYFGVGVSSGKWGFYAAHPVLDPKGRIAGVAVLKINLDNFQEYLGKFDPAFLVDTQNMMIVSSRPTLDFHSLSGMPAVDQSQFRDRYGAGDVSPIFPQPLLDGREVKFGDGVYLVSQEVITSSAAAGWTLTLLLPSPQVVIYRFFGIGTAFLLVVFSLIAAGSNLSVREGANRTLRFEARFRAMFDAAPEAVFVFDPKTRRILEANPFMAQWLGYEPTGLVNLEIDVVLEPEAAPDREAAESRGGGVLAGGPCRRFRRQDGALVDVELTAARILHGDLIREIVFVRDVTQRKQAEDELRQAKEHLENVLENSADPIGIVDRQGRIVGWNKAAVTTFGYSRAELAGKSFSEFYADQDELQKMVSQLRREGSVHRYEIHLRKKDGLIELFALSISLLYDRRQEVMGSVCVARNRSEIKKTMDDLAAVNQKLQEEIAGRQRVEAALAWDARVNASMAELSRALMSSLNLDEMASLVYEHARSLTDSKLAFCGYLNPQTGTLVVPTLTGEVWEACQIKDKKTEFSEFGGLWGWVLQHAQPLLVNDLPADPRSAGTPPGHLPIERFLSVPAIIGDELVGIVALANADRDYTPRDQEVSERLARLYALAIHRQRIDVTLRESESSLQAILDNVQTGVLIIDPESHIIVGANPKALQMVGVAEEHIVGSPCHQFICGAAPGRCPVTDLHETVSNAERRILRPDGTSFWVIQTVAPVTLHGKTHLLESFVDISERKLSEEALSKNYQELQETMARLEQSRNMLQMVIESVPVRVFWKDQELRYMGCNTLFARDAGFSQPQQLLGKDDYGMGWMEQADLYRADDRQVMESRRPKLNIVEPQTTPRGDKIWLNTSKVPMQNFDGEVFGVLGVYEDITERKQAEVAVHAANAKLQALVLQVEARNRTMTLANEMADILQSCQTSEEAYKAISQFLPRFFPKDAVVLYMLNNSRNLFEAVAGWSRGADWSSSFAPDECWSVRRGRLHRVDNPREALSCRHVTESVAGGYLCVPLIAQGETLGVLHLRLGTQKEPGTSELDENKEQLVLMVAEDMALALANLRLRETLRSQAIRDPLTGLFNRRYMEETLERELTRVKRQKGLLGVIMLDLDHFKQYNDTYGHSAGDDLLSALGGLLKSQIREEDIACRYGGEEFLLILPGSSLQVTRERAEILRQAVKEMHLRYRSLKPITLSLGVAGYPGHGDRGLEIIQAADRALYRAKQAGRDRVMAAGEADAPGEGQTAAPVVSLLEAG